MMRVNTLYGTKEVLLEQGRQMELRYYLVQDIRSEMSGMGCGCVDGEDRITYGIRIVKTEDGRQEQECLPGLATSMEAVERLLRQMIYGLVTPMTAAVVADDWVASCH